MSAFQKDTKFTVTIHTHLLSSAILGYTLCLLNLNPSTEALIQLKDVTLSPLLLHSDPWVRYSAVTSLGFLCAGIFSRSSTAAKWTNGLNEESEKLSGEHLKEKREILFSAIATLERLAFGGLSFPLFSNPLLLAFPTSFPVTLSSPLLSPCVLCF